MANEFDGIDFGKLTRSINLAEGIQQSIQMQNEEMEKVLYEANEYSARKDAALFETAEASVAQKELLAQQLSKVIEQNELLKENYSTLKALYDITKKESDANEKSAKNNKIFGWVSFAIGALIGIAGVILG